MAGSRRLRTLVELLLLFALLATFSVNGAVAHPDPPGPPAIKVTVSVKEVKFLAGRHWLGGFAGTGDNEMTDGIDGDAEVYMAILVNRVTHGRFSETKQNDSFRGLSWYPYGENDENVPLYTHVECSPMETPLIVSGNFFELDNTLDAAAEYSLLSTLAGVAGSMLASAAYGAAGGTVAGPGGTVVVGVGGAIVGFISGLTGALDDNDDWGLFSQVYSGAGSQKDKAAGKEGKTEITTEVTVETAKSPPCLGPITATFAGTTTTYTVPWEGAASHVLTWSKIGSDCGTFAQSSAQKNVAAWDHPHPPCPTETHHAATITVTASDGKWECKALYTAGSAAGTGPAPEPCRELQGRSVGRTDPRSALADPESENIFTPLQDALTLVDQTGPEPGDPGGDQATDIRDSYRSIIMGLAGLAAVGALEAAIEFEGASDAVAAFLEAQEFESQAQLAEAIDSYQMAYDAAIAAIESAVPSEGASMPFDIIVLSDVVTSRTGRAFTIPAAILDGSDGSSLSVQSAPDEVAVQITPLSPGPAAFQVDFDLGATPAGTYTVTLLAEDGARSVTHDVTLVVSGEPPSCSGSPASIGGTSGKDNIKGSSSVDVIVGLGGNDTIDGRGRGDLICGGPGNDKLDGGGGDDKLVGGPGTDVCTGGSGKNRVLCD